MSTLVRRMVARLRHPVTDRGGLGAIIFVLAGGPIIPAVAIAAIYYWR
jgi:hypothetical protein